MFRKIYIQECESTNSLVKERDYSEDLCLYTYNQTAGRGQRGNSWECEAGKNLALSILLKPNELTAGQHFIVSEQVALAVTDTVNQLLVGTGWEARIKWPNDIYVGERKVCGILLENTLMGGRMERCIAGIGLNVNQLCFMSDAPNPVSLRQLTGKKLDLEVVLDKLLEHIAYRRSQAVSETEQEYRERLYRRDGFHWYQAGEEQFEARIVGVEQDGYLKLEQKNGEKCGFYFKEVKFIVKNLGF